MDDGGLLYVPRGQVQRIWVPLDRIATTAGGRHEAYQVLEFLDSVKTRRRGDIASRAAPILVERFMDELVSTRMISSSKVLTDARAFSDSTCSIHSVVGSKEYARRAFDLNNLPHRGSIYGFLKMASEPSGSIFPD